MTTSENPGEHRRSGSGLVGRSNDRRDQEQPAPDDTPEQRRDGEPGHAARLSATIEVALGRRVLVIGDLLLPAEASSSSLALADDVAETMERWEGPGVLVVCGNLFAGHPGAEAMTGAEARRALDAHPRLRQAAQAFSAGKERRLVVLAGWRDPEVAEEPGVSHAVEMLGAEVARSAQLRLTTAAGERRVLVEPGRPAAGAGSRFMEAIGGAGSVPSSAPGRSEERRPWLTGIDRLEDPGASNRFVTSRILYRRLGRLSVVVALAPALVALLLRLPIVFDWLTRLLASAPGPRRAVDHAYSASWAVRALVAISITAVVLAVMAVVLAAASRYAWTTLGGGALPRPWSGPWSRVRSRTRTGPGGAPEVEPPGRHRDWAWDASPSSELRVGGLEALDWARTLMAAGVTGLVAGGALRAELTHLDPGFYASPGGTTELVREHPGRFGLPPVFLHHRQLGVVELETGADLHVRLLYADTDLPSSTLLERLVTSDRVVKGKKPSGDLHPALVASWPRGASWPPAPAAAASRARVRRVRRVAAASLFAAGLVDLLIALTPPLRSHLHLIEQVLPLGLAQAAGALVALAGVGLMMLARGVLRGQRRPWSVAVGLLTTSVILHLLHGVDLIGAVVSIAVLAILVVERRSFQAATDRGSVRIAAATLLVAAGLTEVAATAAVEVVGHLRHDHLPSWPLVPGAIAERLAGFQDIALPVHINRWLSPSLLGVGVSLAVVVLYLLTRPVLDLRLSVTRAPGVRRAADVRARDIVRRHGTGTLDYFALRDDKEWFFQRDSLVAYGVYGGVCLVSPDPIGPYSERAHIWDAFRQFADRNGWVVAVMAAAEEWLPVYRQSGMHHVYIGDEAVVNVQTFSLQGGKMKGLRQAVNRVERYGYTVEFPDPATAGAELVAEVAELIGRNRRGEEERGFSMMLGRVFDRRDRGLLLTLVRGPDGAPVALCQFVPSTAIGGYSLDLMRRDPGDHPNGLLDFALCSTIDRLRRDGGRGLSLNFAAMRSTLEGDNGDGLTQRAERWAIRRLSGVLQIESLWRFNAKYEPSWLPRYVVYDSAEHFVPTAVQILRAESLTEMPVVGRMLNPGSRRIPTG